MKTFFLALLLALLPVTVSAQVRKPTLGEIATSNYRQHPRYAGVIGHWMMAEGGGATLYNLGYAGGTSNATLTGSPTWTSGHTGPLLTLNGSNQYGIASNSSTWLAGITNASICGWVFNTAQTASGRELFGFREGDGAGDQDMWLLHTANSDSLEVRIRTSSGNFDQTPSFAGFYGVKTLACLVRLGATAWVYLNGRQISSVGSIAGTWGSGINFEIGTSQVQGLYWNSQIDDVRVYTRTLTPGEVMSLYLDPYAEFRQDINALKTAELLTRRRATPMFLR